MTTRKKPLLNTIGARRDAREWLAQVPGQIKRLEEKIPPLRAKMLAWQREKDWMRAGDIDRDMAAIHRAIAKIERDEQDVRDALAEYELAKRAM